MAIDTGVIEDSRRTTTSAAARGRWFRVHVTTDTTTYSGGVFAPEGYEGAAGLLGEPTPFLFLEGAQDLVSGTIEPFLAIDKSVIQSLRVVEGARAESQPAPGFAVEPLLALSECGFPAA